MNKNKSLEIENKGDLVPIQVTNLRKARKLLTRTITQIQKDSIHYSKARTLTYCLGILINLFKDEDILKRLEQLEARINEASVISN